MRSYTKLSASPYSTQAKQGGAEVDAGGSNDFLVQQNQELIHSQGILRSQLQEQSFKVDGLKSDLFQKQLENEDLRQRLQYLETLTGKDSSMIRD